MAKNRPKARGYQRAYYARHADRINASVARRMKRLRRGALDAYGGKCACCGESTEQFLAIDHMNGNGGLKHNDRFRSGTGLYYWLRDNGYPAGFQVLCHNCNLAKGFYGRCPHAA